MSTVLLWLFLLGTFLYGLRFAIVLWRDQNKLGAIVVILIAIAIVIAPFLSGLRNYLI